MDDSVRSIHFNSIELRKLNYRLYIFAAFQQQQQQKEFRQFSIA